MYYLQNATASGEQLEKVVVVLCHGQEWWEHGGKEVKQIAGWLHK